ncbi:hypothetical protein PENSPDRAFT_679148 [Peniophora sp. CONT]|nr:hypothetical protein PENSPDRAFT_679148 [Peniophora sp. CONT]
MPARPGFVPLKDQDEERPPYAFNSPRSYRVSKKAVILSALAFAVFLPATIFVALLTSHVKAQKDAAIAASSAASVSSISRSSVHAHAPTAPPHH